MNQDIDDQFEDHETRLIAPVYRDRSIGSVPGLPDDELAGPAELERQVVLDEWGPILALPVCWNGSWIRPNIDEKGNYDWGAFGTVDFERLRGPFDKARFKVDKLQEDVRDAVLRLEMFSERLSPENVTAIQERLRDPSFDFNDLEDNNEYGFANWYSRVKRLRSEIRELHRYSWERRNAE